MIDKILSLLKLKNISSSDLIKKGLEKVNPKFSNFFQEAGKYGHSLGATLGFLQSEFGGSSKIDETSRPDEQANLELQRQSELPGRIAATAGKTALGAALGGAGGAALSGLGASMGQQGQQPQGSAPQQQQQPSDPLSGLNEFPELVQFIKKEQSSGGNAQSIASKARKSSRLSDQVNSIEEHSGEPFEDILSRLIGQPQQSSPGTRESPTARLAALIQAYKQNKGRR